MRLLGTSSQNGVIHLSMQMYNRDSSLYTHVEILALRGVRVHYYEMVTR